MSSLFNAAYKDSFGSTPNDDVFSVANGMNQLQLFRLMYEKQKMENERYGQMTPMELDIKNLEAARSREQSNPEFVRQFALGNFGDSQTKQAKGAEDMATLGGRITKTNQANETERFNSENNYIVSALDRAITTGDRSGLPESYRNLPKEALVSLQDTMKTTLADTPTQRASIKLENVKGENQAAVAEIQGMDNENRTRLDNASREKIAFAHNKTLKDIENSKRSETEKQRTFEQLASYYINEMHAATTDADKKAWKEAAEDAYRRGLAYKEAAAVAKAREEAAAFAAMQGSRGSGQPAQQPSTINPNANTGWGGREIK